MSTNDKVTCPGVASQNSGRRSLEHLRRVARASRSDALCERRVLLTVSTDLRARCTALRSHILQVLKDRSDPTVVPNICIKRIKKAHTQNTIHEPDSEVITIEELVQQSVNQIFKDKTDKRIDSAKIQSASIPPVSIDTKKMAAVKPDVDIQRIEYDTECLSDYQKLDFDKSKQLPEFSDPLTNLYGKLCFDEGGVLNVCVTERRRSHDRKQLAPKPITYVFTDNDDGVIEFSIKEETQ